MFKNEFEVILENPFEKDKLNRASEIIKLTRLFEAVGNKMVLAIDSPWGTGKSTFLNMWSCNLKNDEYKTIFFNAWENDFMEEPFIAFVSAIREEIEQSKNKVFIEYAQKIGTLLLKGTPTILGNVIEKYTGVDVKEDVGEVEAFVGKQIEDYKSNRDSIIKFKKELSKIAEEVMSKSGKPIVIFIDELDRCRPNYAIALLERIKHIFSVPNIIFILGIDKEALSNSIKVVYGNGTDINGYLSRFIDMEYTLNQANKEKYIQYLIDKLKFQELINKSSLNYNEFCKIVREIIINFNVALRDAEKILADMYITMSVTNVHPKFIYTYTLLIIMKKIDIEVYRKIKDQKISTEYIVKKFDKDNKLSQWTQQARGVGVTLVGQLIWLLNESDKRKELEEACKDINSKQYQTNKRLLEIIEWSEKSKFDWDYEGARDILEKLTMKIEMYEGLNTL